VFNSHGDIITLESTLFAQLRAISIWWLNRFERFDGDDKVIIKEEWIKTKEVY